MLEDPLQRHQGVAQVCTPAFMASTRVWLDSNAAQKQCNPRSGSLPLTCIPLERLLNQQSPAVGVGQRLLL